MEVAELRSEAGLGPVDIYFSQRMAAAKDNMAANDTAVFS